MPKRKCMSPFGKYESPAALRDACYKKVTPRYDGNSAYRSAAIAKCRKVGVSNWGEGGKKD